MLQQSQHSHEGLAHRAGTFCERILSRKLEFCTIPMADEIRSTRA